jgi:excisionase family DNA binding protein
MLSVAFISICWYDGHMAMEQRDKVMATIALGKTLVSPSEREAKAAEESLRTLASYVGDGELRITVRNGKGNEEIHLPAPATTLLLDLLNELRQGNAVALNTVHPELTTQQAADLLNVSRPYLVKLLDEGTIPFRKIGTHRRVLREDVLSYKKELRSQQEKAMIELVRLSEEMGLYDEPAK